MRKLILAVVAGGLLSAAVYGAAASLGTVTGQNIAASDSTVVACDTNGFDVDYTTILDTTTFPAIQRVSEVKIASGLDLACANQTFRLRLTNDPDGVGAVPSTVIKEHTMLIPPAFVHPVIFTLAVPLPAVSAIDDMHWTQES